MIGLYVLFGGVTVLAGLVLLLDWLGERKRQEHRSHSHRQA